jgi:hypothetical protein
MEEPGRSDFPLNRSLKSAEGDFGAQNSPNAFRAWVSVEAAIRIRET